MSPLRMARDGDPFDRALLRAGRNEEPPRGAEERALAGLGLSATPPNVAARPRLPLGARSAGALKVIAGVSVLALVAGAIRLGAPASRQGFAPPSPAVGAEAAHAITVPERATLAVPEGATLAVPGGATVAGPDVTAAVPACPTALSPAPLVARTRDPARRSAPHATTKVVPNEVALVQQAAQALARRDAVGALAILDAYDHQWPHGALAEEAGALRVEALARTD